MLAALASCAPDSAGIVDGGDDEGPGGVVEPANKNIDVWYAWITAYRRIGTPENLEGFMEFFAEDNPDYSVEYKVTDVGNTNQLAVAIGTNTQPDLVTCSSLSAYYYADVIQSFEPYIANDAEYERGDLHKINEYGLINGEQYGLLGSVFTYFMAYNRDFFEDFNLDPDVYPKTWREMLEFQPKLTQYDETGKVIRTGFLEMEFYSTHIFSAFYRGENVLNPQGYEVNVNTDGMYEYISWTKAMEEVFGGRGMLSRSFPRKEPDSFRAGNVAMLSTWFAEDWLGVDFDYRVVPCPNHEDADKEYAMCYFDDVYMLVKNARNPDGAWFYMKWYLTSGALQVAEMANYYTDPVNYFPRFYTHSYTRQRCYDMFIDEETSEATKKAIAMRDEIMDRDIIYAYMSATGDFFSVTYTGISADMTARKVTSVREYLDGMQKKGDRFTEKWLDDMEDKGWVIDPVNDPWGYYAGK